MIIEVMGRNCGYLALVSAMATEATFTFMPESPPPENWAEVISEKIEYVFEMFVFFVQSLWSDSLGAQKRAKT